MADGSHGRPEMAITFITGRNTQKEDGGIKNIVLVMVRGVVILSIIPVQLPMTSVQ